MAQTRRELIVGGAAVTAALALGRGARAADKKEAGKKDEDEVPPTEDLMREHGILRRVLLVYGEVLRRFSAGQEVPVAELAHAAAIIREFIEDYHEKDEE
ncbi:MAG TPA: hemerythrin domain-containing protein, partial [Polyangia bacterium]